MGVKRSAADEIVRVVKRTKTPTSTKAIAKEALRKVNRIEREVESKADDYTYSVAIAVAGTINEVSLIPQGVARNERVGDVVVPTKLSIGLYLSATTGTAVRYMVIQAVGDWVPAVGASAADILATTPNMTAPVNFDNRKQFTVLYDHMYTVPSPDATDNNIVVDQIVVFPKKKIKYDAATPTYGVGTIDGAIYIFQMGDGSACSCVSFCRLWYKDA